MGERKRLSTRRDQHSYLCYVAMVALTMIMMTRSTSAKLFGEDDDDTKKAYVCLKGSETTVSVECKSNEKISIKAVSYGAEPGGCGDWSDRNDCLQTSTKLTEAAKQNCDGKPTCSLTKVPLSKLQDDPSHLILPVQNGCGVNGNYYSRVDVNYMVVKYRCQEYQFCKKIENRQAKALRIETESYPLKTVTNPTCSCTFTSEDKSTTSIVAYATCNGTLTFVIEEERLDPDRSDKFEKFEERYFCNNSFPPVIIQIGKRNTVSMKVNVDIKNSSEMSAYSMRFQSTVTKYVLGSQQRKTKRDALITVDCEAGALYLTATVQLILYITVPTGVVILIALIVLYCCISKRRKRNRQWRRQNIRLPADEDEKDDVVQNGKNQYYPPGSPMESEVSTPPSSRKKPDGKIDTDSEDDLAEVANLLHQQNQQRRMEELYKREFYYKDSPTVTWTGTQRPFIPVTFNSQNGGPRLNLPVRDIQRLEENRRCSSFGNVCQAEQDGEKPKPRPLKSSKSVSNSRSSVRSAKRRAPQPPGYEQVAPQLEMRQRSASMPRREVVYVPGHYEEVTLRDNDPGLNFDDPRVKPGAQEYAPRRSPMRSRSNTQEFKRSMNTQSVNHNNHTKTTNDSNKNRNKMSSKPPVRPKPEGIHNQDSSNYNHQSHNKHTDRKKHNTSDKYFNPYAVALPTPKSKSSDSKNQNKKGGKHSSDSNGGIASTFMSTRDERRYSITSEHDNSDHDLEDMEQVDVMGDLDMGGMDMDMGDEYM